MWGRAGLAGRQNGGGGGAGGGGGGGGGGEDRSDEAQGNGTLRVERDRQRGSEGGRATDGLVGGVRGGGGEEGEGSNLPPHHDPHQGKDLPPHQEMGQLSVQVSDLLR